MKNLGRQFDNIVLFAGCPGCGPSIFVKYGEDETRVRCLRCRGTPISLSLIHVISKCVGQLSRLSVYEASSRGTVVNFLRKRALTLTISEFFPEIPRGESRSGIQCQDLQSLTFRDDAFDLCSSTEVFEHIADDQKAFKEILRVLRPGGTMAFTVPIHAATDTIQRAQVVNGETVHLLPPAFHGDRLTGSNSVLVYRDYGLDIVERVRCAGFSEVQMVNCDTQWFGYSRQVVVARKK